MAATTIKAQNAAAAFVVDGVTYTDHLDRVDVQSNAPVENETTFANEDSGGDFSVGTEILTLVIGGPLRFDQAGTGPFLPVSDFQDKTWSLTYITGCSISGTLSMTSTGIDNVAGTTRRHRSTAINKGAFVVTWDRTS